MHKSSPKLTIKHRRSKDLTYSSQESLNTVATTPVRDTPSPESKDERSKTPELNLRNQKDVIQEEGVNDNQSQNEAPPPSSDPPTPNSANNSLTEKSTSNDGPSISVDNISSDDKSQTSDRKTDSFSDGHSDRQTRERSFERSLDSIMDRCSEKSLDLNLSADALNGSASDTCRTPDFTTPPTSAKYSKSEKKKKSWYTMLAPTYKSKTDDFRKTFKDIPPEERLIVDYSCALQKDILVQGRMYITQNWICFYANIFRWETVLTISCKDVTAITKEKTARVIPNAIQITSDKEKYFFTSFGARDKTYMMLFRIWQNALMDQPMNTKELWQWIHYSYGEELGLASSDDDYIPPPGLDDLREQFIKEEDYPVKDDLEDNTDSETHAEPIGLMVNENSFLLEEDEVFKQQTVGVEPPVPMIAPRAEDMSDYSDTSEDSEGEIACSGHSHLQKCYLDEVFCIPVDKIFEYVFTDSGFFRQFVGSRKTFDLDLSPWQEEPDSDGNRIRAINYTLTLNHSIGPKISPSTEKQICYKQSEPGTMYVVDAEVSNGGIPYADAFSVTNRYCLTRVSQTKARVHVTSDVIFKKSVIGIVKGMIERSAVSGLTDYFRSLSAHLRREAERNESVRISHQPKKRTLRRRRKILGSASDNVLPTRQMDRQTTSIPPSPMRSGGMLEARLPKMNADAFIRIICFVLILLVMFNALLFYKLWSLESFTNAVYFPHSNDIIDKYYKKYPRSQTEWVRLLKQQKILQDGEIKKWREVLSASILLIDQIKGTLVQLHNTLDNRKKPVDKRPAGS